MTNARATVSAKTTRFVFIKVIIPATFREMQTRAAMAAGLHG